MLSITVMPVELFDEEKQEFYQMEKPQELLLEHSLISISKWESITAKSFLKEAETMTLEQLYLYIECMTLSKNVDPLAYKSLSVDNIMEIQTYLGSEQTATTITERQQASFKKRNPIITAELIYYWMIALEIPWEAQKWHIKRLLTLIQVCSIKNQEATAAAQKKAKPSSKINNPNMMTQAEIIKQNHEINERRKKELGTRG